VNTVGGVASWVVPSAVGGAAVAVATARVSRRTSPQRTAASASGSVNAPA
jgi:hypothetical protein